jgi:hypothetical protein
MQNMPLIGVIRRRAQAAAASSRFPSPVRCIVATPSLIPVENFAPCATNHKQGQKNFCGLLKKPATNVGECRIPCVLCFVIVMHPCCLLVPAMF